MDGNEEDGRNWLDGLRVVGRGRGLAASMVATTLADLGADVVRVVEPTEPLVGLERTLARGQRVLPLDLASASGQAGFLDWARRADILIASDDAEHPSPSEPLKRESLRSQNPRLVELTLPGYADAASAARAPNAEAALSALGGLYSRPGPLSPQYFPFPLLSVVAALHGLVGLLAARLAADREGVGQRVVVERAEIAPSLVELTHLLSAGPPGFGNALRWASSPFVGVFRCQGSWLYLHAALSGHAGRLLEVLAREQPKQASALSPLLAQQFDRDPLLPRSPRAAHRAARLLAQAFEGHTAGFWEDRLGKAQVSAARVRSLAEFASGPAGQQSASLCGTEPAPGVLLQRDGVPRAGWQPDAPRDIPPETRPHWPLPTALQAAGSPELARSCLYGVRVLDLSRIIAGPSAGRTLAWLGADVLKVEDPVASPAFGTAFRVLFDRGKRIEPHNLRTETGRAHFWHRVEEFRPDIVLTNYRPDAALRLGLDAPTLARRLPQAVLVRISCYGSAGPLGGFPGWEQTAQATSGMQHALGQGGRPKLLPLPACDLGTGLVAAFGGLLGLWRRERGLATPPLEAALVRTATWLQCRQLAPASKEEAFDALGETPLPRLYRCRRGHLLVAGAGTPATYAALLAELGAQLPGDASPDSVQQALARALKRRSAGTWSRRLRRRFGASKRPAATNVNAVVPRGTARVLRDRQRRPRGLIQTVRYPQYGRVRHATLPLQMSRSPLASLGPTHLLAPKRPAHGLGRRLRRRLQARWEQVRFAPRALRNL